MSTPPRCVVILAGGGGTRFWPLSTEERPKQVLPLLGERTLLQQAFDRLGGLVPPSHVLVLTSHALVATVREQLPLLPPGNLVGEPLRRDTAAAVALATSLAEARYGADSVVAVVTADHAIGPKQVFQADLRAAFTAATAHPAALFTFGIRPTRPSTAYGYLERGEVTGDAAGDDAFPVLRFHEKPSAEVARSYVASGRFLWNAGMFVWCCGAIRAELERQLPDHLRRIDAATASFGDPGFAAALEAALEPLPAVSIDHGVMEGARDVRGRVARFAWSDVGGWAALGELLDADGDGNRHRGGLITRDAADNIVFCEDEGETVALIGVTGLVVVRAGGRTLVVPRDRAEEVKLVVSSIDGEVS